MTPRTALVLSFVAAAVSCKSTPDPGPPSATPTSSGMTNSASPSPDPRTPLGPAPSSAVLAADAKGARTFSALLYKAIPKNAADNVFFSPASVRVALSMTQAGARGATAAEMAKVLALSSDPNEAEAASGYVLRAWNRRGADLVVPTDAEEWRRKEAESKRETLRVVNRIWGQKGKTFLPAFVNTLQTAYEAPLVQLDFKAAPEPARGEINAWVERATEQKIKDLLAPGIVNTDTRLVLTNAVYFKASWKDPFLEFMTKDEPFRGPTDVKVKMMHLTEKLPYAEVGDAKVLELPYASENTSMIVVLPNAQDGLAKLEASLDEAKLQAWTSAPSRTKVIVSLPRFKTTSSFSLAETLSAMGMPQAFDAKRADFSGMDGTKELFISAVVHKAFVAVDEKGTEAAAATAVAMAAGAAPMKEPEPKEFKADHPFLFFVQDKKLGHVLFMGRVVDPTR